MVQLLFCFVTFLSLVLQSSSVACEKDHELEKVEKFEKSQKFILPPIRDRTNSTGNEPLLGRVRILEAGSIPENSRRGKNLHMPVFKGSSSRSKHLRDSKESKEYPNLAPEPGPSYNSAVAPPRPTGGGGGGGGYSYSHLKPIGPPMVIKPTMAPTQNPPEPELPQPTPPPPSPTSAETEIPIIGGGDEDEEGLPPAPPPSAFGVGDEESAFLKPHLSKRKGRLRTTGPLRQSERVSSLGRLGGGFGQKISPVIPEDPNIIMDFSFSNIKCFRTNKREYFGAMIHLKNGFHLPYIRDKPEDSMAESADCRLERTDSSQSYQMSISDMKRCGVEACGDSYCLTMVFPRVPTLALAEDEVTTIKCLPQKPTMSEAKTISFAGDSLESRRSSSTVEGGGQEFAAEVGVFRQNAGANNGLFTKRVNSGGVVQLGEPLQLRSVVRGGDGWAHSRLSDVKVWRMRDSFNSRLAKDLNVLNPNDAAEVITLVDENGCRNPEYQVIAESSPLKDPRNDLVYHFTFKAFLFRGQRANEPLIVTSKVKACQDEEECAIICGGHAAESAPHPSILNPLQSLIRRYRRSGPVEVKNISSIVHDYSSQMALRVVGLKDQSAALSEQDFPPEEEFWLSSRAKTPLLFCAERMFAAAFIGAFIMFLLSGLTFAIFSYVRRGKIDRNICSSMLPFGQGPQASPGGPPTNGRNGRNYFHQQPEGSGGFQPPPERLPSGQPSIRGKSRSNFHPDLIRRNPQLSPPIKTQEDGPKSGILSKPLPSLPPLQTSDEKNEKLFTKSDVAKLLKRLNSTELRDPPREVHQEIYESIEAEPGGTKQKDENGFYIVYCVNDKGKKRISSAPGSLRQKRRGKGGSTKGKSLGGSVPSIHFDTTEMETSDQGGEEEEAEESDDSYGFNRGGGQRRSDQRRRTVRSVKRTNQKNKGIRRRLSSFYREMNRRSFHSTSNTPSALAANSKFSGHSRVSFAKDQNNNNIRAPNFKQNNGEIFSPNSSLSSDMDSAYCSSTISSSPPSRSDPNSQKINILGLPPLPPPKARDHRPNYVNYPSNVPQFHNIPQPAQRRSVHNSTQSYFGGTQNFGDSSVNAWDSSHIVTQNEQSTQILIMPETNV